MKYRVFLLAVAALLMLSGIGLALAQISPQPGIWLALLAPGLAMVLLLVVTRGSRGKGLLAAVPWVHAIAVLVICFQAGALAVTLVFASGFQATAAWPVAFIWLGAIVLHVFVVGSTRALRRLPTAADDRFSQSGTGPGLSGPSTGLSQQIWRTEPS